MRVAVLTTDNRENYREYHKSMPYFGTAPEALLQGFATLPEMEVHVVSCTRRTMASPGKLADNIWFHSLHVLKTGWLRTGYQGCIRAVRKRLKEIQPEMVHGQGTERDCAISAVFSSFPNVLTIHGNMRDAARVAHARFGSYLWCAAQLENFVLKRTAGVFCNSRHTGQVVAPRAKKTWLVPNALRAPFLTKPLPSGRKSRCILLHVGVVCENKQQLKVLEVARSLHRKNPGLEVWFLGSADPQANYARTFLDRMREAEAEGCAHYLGTAKNDEELVTCFDQASALVHTPLFEAFGLVVAEALARNLKLFATSVGGITDIASGVEGVELFDPNDWSGLETAITRWVKAGHPPPAGAPGLMQERYHPAHIARRHVEIYREVLDARS